MKFSLRHKSTGSVYPYIVPTGHLMLRGFFQKIYVNDRHRVPTDKPVLLASNHPTAFIDPCLLCTLLDAPLYNMTRGDIFRKPFYRNMMESINMFPVFRSRDGNHQRYRNNEVFEFCIGKLLDNQVVTIYVEGEHHLEKHVRPAQKGIALIAMRALVEEGISDLQIIPAGCNYVYGDRPRDIAMVNIGQPIDLGPALALYPSDPKQALNRLCQDIENALKAICFHIEDPADELLAERLLELDRGDHNWPALPVVQYDHPRFWSEKAVLDELNALPAAEKEQLRRRVDAYFRALEQAGTDDFSLQNAGSGHWWWAVYFVLLFPVFALGYLSAWPILAVARAVTRKTVRKKEFMTSVWMGTGHLFGMLYYFLWLLASLFTLNPVWIAAALSLPLMGWYNMLYREHFRRWRGQRKALGLPQRELLLEMRSALRSPSGVLV